LITAGYHLSALLIHFFSTRKNDFIEMGLHHTVAIFLYSGAYLINFLEIGIVLSFLHDLSDIFTRSTQCLAETKYNTLTMFQFIICMIVWFYSRILLLPYFIYQTWMEDKIDFHSPIFKPFGCFLLSNLFILHLYWFFLFC
jgi:hypothetical protein